jgi:ABC-type transport system involved in multi-copper enzyme maturation permease subunit
MIDTTATTEAAEAAIPAPDATDVTTDGAVAAATAAAPRVRRSPFAALRRTAGGIGAVSVKELRGRMRGRRAFVILTIYLLLLGGFALMVELIAERSYSSGFGGTSTFATASIGQGIFAALLLLETLQVAFLAPAATAGAISLEREKRTLELLVVTPISSLAIVLGKLFSALIYVWLLIAASIPLTAVVFVYGGVAPEDILRGYLVLVVTALGLGSMGLFASSLVRRTQAATAISVFAVLFVSIGTVFLLVFWGALANDDGGRGAGPIKGQAPRVIAYLNPFLAQVDVLCGTEASFGGWCSIESTILPDPNGVQFTGTDPAGRPIPIDNTGGGGGVVILPADGKGVPDVAPAPFGVVRDAFWPMSVLTWLILSAVFIVLSVQFVSPTRRWHIRRGRRNPGSVAT